MLYYQENLKLKFLRNTIFDPFRYSHDRKLERSLINDFEDDLDKFLDNFNEINKDKINELFSLPQNIKGFGPVKEASINATQLRRAELLLELENESLEKFAAE